MHQRKQLMAIARTASSFLPGGYGTLDDFEMLTWLQLGCSASRWRWFNVGGYFDPLLHWIQHAVDSGFVAADQAACCGAATPSGTVTARAGCLTVA